MIRFATIGTNFIVEWFLKAAERCEELEYAVTYSRKAETANEFAKIWGARRICTDLEVLAADFEIDAVYIASPNVFHYEQTALFLSKGKHVLCEKPITSNAQELQKLIQIAKDSKTVLLEAIRPAFDPGLTVIKEQLPELGVIRRVSFQCGKYSSRYDAFKAGSIENAFNPALSNGALMDIGVYTVHPLVRLFGMPEDVQADAIFLSNGLDGAGIIRAGYDGMQAVLSYSKIANSYVANQIQGEKGCLVFDDIVQPRLLSFYDNRGGITPIQVAAEPDNMIYEVREWVNLITKGIVAHPHHEYSLMEMQLMDEARRKMKIVFPADQSVLR